MDILLNFGLAWISVLLTLLLSVIYFTRKAIIGFPKKRPFFILINKALRKYHKSLGIALIITGFIHGLFSSDQLLSVNWGTALWVLSLLLGITWLLRKKLKKNWMFYHRILTVAFSLVLVIHIVDIGGIQIFNMLKQPPPSLSEYQQIESAAPVPLISNTDSTPSPESTANATKTQPNVYKDGIYTGIATGFQPGLTVSVTINDNKIVLVEVTEHNEINSRYWGTPVSVIPLRIVETQTTEVDTISGASYTSAGIINAVNDALRQALVSGKVPDDISP